MKRLALRFYFLIGFILCRTLAYSQDITQNQNVENTLESIFSELQVDSVKTGYLLDRAFEVSNVRSFNGTALTDSNYVDVNTFRNIILTMNSASVNNTGTTFNANEITDALADTVSVRIAGALYKYNYFLSNALSDNLISFQGGKVKDVTINGIWQNPYGNAYVFACTPNRSIKTGSSVRFRFDANQFIGNITPTKIEFDAGDGSGYHIIYLPYDNTTYYTSDGVKDLKFKVTIDNQIVLESHSQINLLPPPSAPSGAPLVPPGHIHPISCFYNGSQVSANVAYTIGSNNGGVVKRPIIYVEGFDIGALSIINNFLNDSYLLAPIWIESLMTALFRSYYGGLSFDYYYPNFFAKNATIASDYDIFYVDWLTPMADIKANAYLLSDIIQWVNSIKGPDAEKNIVYGHSMGGLIARYALCLMENSDTPHQTTCYVSHDSPHLGANVPIGAVYLLRDFYSFLYGDSYQPGFLTTHLFDPAIAACVGILESTAARQMIYNYVDRDGIIDNTVHDDWQGDLADIGFPRGDYGFPIENLAIVNGCQQTPAPPDTLFSLRMHVGHNLIGWQQPLLNLITPLNGIDASIIAYRNHGGSQTVSRVSAVYKKKLLGMELNIPLIIPFVSGGRPRYAPAGSIGLDYVNASWVLDSIPKRITSIDYNDTVRFDLIGPVRFIPAASALACDNYNTDFYAFPPKPLTETPFDSYFINGSWNNAHHMIHFRSAIEWILNQRSMHINGPEGIVLTGDCFSASGVPGLLASPSSSDSTIVSINPYGTITVNSPGNLATLSFSNHNGSEHYYKHKKVLAGFPSDLCLYASFGFPRSSVSASTPRDIINHYLDSLANKGFISFEWGEQGASFADTSWTSTSSRSYTVQSDATQTVFFRIKRGNDYSAILNIPVFGVRPPQIVKSPFQQDPSIIYTYWGNVWMNYSVFDDPGEMYYNPNTGVYELGASNAFVVWHSNFPLFANTPDPDRIIINNQTIMLDRTTVQTINGTPTNMFCFKILDSTYVQNIIANISNYTGNSAIVEGSLFYGNTFLQDFTVVITQQFPPLP